MVETQRNSAFSAGSSASSGRKGSDSRPVVLLVDDDPIFLHLNEECWREEYRQKAILHTLNPMEGLDPVAWIRDCLANRERLDAVYLDENIPGKSGLDILEEIRRVPQAHYLPIVVMTAHRDKESDAEALEKGALRYIHKRKDSNILEPFLSEALFILPQLRDQAEDAMWTDLLRNMTTQLMDNKLSDVVDMAAEFLEEHFGNSITYVRERNADSLRLLGTKDQLKAGPKIALNAVPYLTRLLNPQECNVVRRDSLSLDDVGNGIGSKLKGFRLVAVPLVLRERRIGTITLYRSSDRPPFRRKDEVFLQHFALQISSAIGARQELQQLRQRQTYLAQFVQEMSNARDEKEACESLASFLHQEVNDADDEHASTIVRLLQPGKKTIQRISTKGLPTRGNNVRDIYQEDSVFARVIWNRKSETCGDITNNVSQADPTKKFVFTIPLQSSLTVPLLSVGHCLGAVNAGHLSPNAYSQEDQEFTEAIARITAHTLVRLKAQRFLTGLLTLVNDLVQPTPMPTEAILSRAFALLHDFTGYARLLYLGHGSQ